jgi:hypothetical protein
VPIVGPAHITARRTYRYDGSRDGSKVRVQLELTNDKASGLGAPLPEGRVRIYATGAGSAEALAGEDRIQHTAAGEGATRAASRSISSASASASATRVSAT